MYFFEHGFFSVIALNHTIKLQLLVDSQVHKHQQEQYDHIHEQRHMNSGNTHLHLLNIPFK